MKKDFFCALKREHILSCDTFFPLTILVPAVASFAHLVFSKGGKCLCSERDRVMQSAFADELLFCFFQLTCLESPSMGSSRRVRAMVCIFYVNSGT